MPFFFQEKISYFRICYTGWPCHFYFKVPRSCLFLYLCFSLLLQFFFFFNFSFGNDFLTSHLTSPQTFLSYPITFANNLFCLFKPCTQFFSIFLIPRPPFQKSNGPSLLIWCLQLNRLIRPGFYGTNLNLNFSVKRDL